MRDTTTSGRSPAVRRAARILSALAIQHEPTGLAELSRRLAMPKSSLADVCGTLVETGMLVRDVDGRLQLGPRLSEIARGLVGGTRLLELFHAETRNAEGLDDRTVVLAILSGNDVAYLSVREGARPLPLTVKPGMRLPAWSTGTGWALLGTLPDAVIVATHDGPVPVSPGGQAFDPDRLLEAVALGRDRGFACNAEAGGMGLVETAALVHGAEGPLAAVASIVDIGARGGDTAEGDAVSVQALARRLTQALELNPPLDPRRRGADLPRGRRRFGVRGNRRCPYLHVSDA